MMPRLITGRSRLDRYFALSERASTVRTEILGGVSTFLALSYIVVVNPTILAQGGIPWGAAFFATALVGGLATIAMGIWGRLPFAVAPGMEVNALVAFTVVGKQGFSWQEALGLVFWSGVAMLAVTVLGWRGRVIAAIPPELGLGLVVSVAAFIATVGCKVAGFTSLSAVTAHNLVSAPAIALYVGLGLALLLTALDIRGAVLLAIIAAGIYCALAGVKAGDHRSGGWSDAVLHADVGVIVHPRGWQVVLVLFALDFFGSAAKLVGLSAGTSIEHDGEIDGVNEALLVDGAATVGGAALGSTSFVAFVESSVGIRAGARTGIASVVTGVLLLLCLAFSGVANIVPAGATAGALVFVAVTMLPGPRRLRRVGAFAAATAALMAVITVWTGALDQAILAGLVLTLLRVARQRRVPSAILLVVTPLLGISVVLQYLTG